MDIPQMFKRLWAFIKGPPRLVPSSVELLNALKALKVTKVLSSSMDDATLTVRIQSAYVLYKQLELLEKQLTRGVIKLEELPAPRKVRLVDFFVLDDNYQLDLSKFLPAFVQVAIRVVTKLNNPPDAPTGEYYLARTQLLLTDLRSLIETLRRL